jgi:hypothetical protein
MNSSETKYVFFLDTNATEDLTENKIRSFSRLPQGWYYGEGVPASEEVIETSLELYKWARELLFFEFEAFPGANGEVLLGIYKGNYVLDLIVEPDLSVTATLEKDGEEIYDDYELTVDEAKEGIRQLRKDSKWMQSDFSTQINIVTSSEGSKALHSKTQE